MLRSKPLPKGRRASQGISMVEFALILPILLTLLLGVIDFSRAIHFNNIISTMSREGANLASRTSQSSESIISVLNFTSAPLDMRAHGIMYISRIKGVSGGNNTVIAVVDEQQRPKSNDGNMALNSRLWTCPSWTSSGKCNVPTSTLSRTVTLPFPLTLGGEVYFVEVVYEYLPFTGYLIQTDLDLYSSTFL